jgi:lysophospholipase L1-like esterase
MRKFLLRKALLTIIWLLFIFVLLEAAGFILFTFTTVKSIGSYGYPDGLYVSHSSLNYLYKPGFKGYFVGGEYKDIAFQINSYGFRDDPFMPRSPGRRRIVFIGDSIVFGSGVWEKDRFTEQLGEDQIFRDAGIEVLNLGVNSYNFGHYLQLARLRFMDLTPDIVVVGFTLNDIQEMEGVWPEKRVKRQKEKLLRRKWYDKPIWVGQIQQSLGRTYAGKFVEYLEKTVKQRRTSEADLTNYHTKWMRSAVTYWSEDKNGERLHGELRMFQKEMSRLGVPFVFLIFPEMNDLLHPGKYSLPRKSIRNMLDKLDLAYCDAYDAFASMPDIDSLYLNNDSVHFTPAGHSVIKDALLACTKAEIIPLPPSTEDRGN